MRKFVQFIAPLLFLTPCTLKLCNHYNFVSCLGSTESNSVLMYGQTLKMIPPSNLKKKIFRYTFAPITILSLFIKQ